MRATRPKGLRAGRAAALAVAALAAGRVALADVPAQCRFPSSPVDLDLAGTLHSFYSPTVDCCDAVAMYCPTSGNDLNRYVSPAIWQGRKNIVLFIADDHAYCHYGFMAGECDDGARVNQVCRSNVDCPMVADQPSAGTANCLAKAASGTQKLRLNEPTCRNRQPPSKDSGACAGNVDPKGAKPGDKKSFRFQRSNFPCTGTDLANATGPPPVPLTPHLDTLASQGAVFTRAHVGGTACKSSRPVMLFGKPHRHLRAWHPTNNTGYSIAYWLSERTPTSAPPSPSPPGTDLSEWRKYRTYLVGKGEVLKEHEGGFQGGKEDAKTKTAKFRCDNAGNCQNAEKAGTPEFLKIPWEVRQGHKTDGVGDALAAVFGVYRQQFINDDEYYGPAVRRQYKGLQSGFSCVQCRPQQDAQALPVENSQCAYCTSSLENPFFLWYAPNQPHKHGQGTDFEALYPGYEKNWLKYASHITQTDLAFGALVDELRRHCVCGKDGTKDSLLDHTVILYLADHGFFLPGAKRNENENTDRTVLIVSEPGHRTNFVDATPISHHPFESDFAHAIDLLPTILDYAGIDYPHDPADPSASGTPYPLAHSLVPWVHGSTAAIRQVQYGEDAGQNGLTNGIQRGNLRTRFLVLRQGQVGLCTNADDPEYTGAIRYGTTSGEASPHVRPCFITGNPENQGECGEGYTCSTTAKRCVNNPHRLCSAHAECTADGAFDPAPLPVCDTGAGRCRYVLQRGSLGDMGRPATPISVTSPLSRTCSADADCRPLESGLCQPVLLKIVQDKNWNIASAYDLLWDPDQEHDLLKPSSKGGDPAYLGAVSPTPDPDFRLRTKAKQCLDRYWTLSADQWNPNAGTCAWAD
jgi:arylsulfatase A-like enzyme